MIVEVFTKKHRLISSFDNVTNIRNSEFWFILEHKSPEVERLHGIRITQYHKSEYYIVIR